jgi:cell fate regulator YaaT (PSP1 superfamily)
MNETIVGIRFSKVGKIYHFDATDLPGLQVGEAVIVETSRGIQLGFVANIVAPSLTDNKGSWKKVTRRANPKDLLIRQNWMAKQADAVQFCQIRIKELDLRGIKIVAAEYSFDGSRLSLMFNSESEDKLELKSLKRELQKRYSPAQIEIRQIGPRDMAKSLCGMGACGLETRCCCKFLTDFSSISIKMAKEQGISLTPPEITGMCGRLRCCLNYEFEQYNSLRQALPRKNKSVMTPLGEGRVVEVRTLREEVVVDLPEIGKKIFKNEEIQKVENDK